MALSPGAQSAAANCRVASDRDRGKARLGEPLRWLALPTLLLVVAATFVVIRCQTNLVFDDTPALGFALYDRGSLPRLEGLALLRELVCDSFGQASGSGYRPLSALIANVGREVFLGHFVSPLAWLCFIGLIHGATACSIFLVARRFVTDERWALLAVFLFLFSAPYITAAWVVFAGIQAIVSLVLCSGLLLYWRLAERRPRARWAGFALCLLMFFGPWFREFIGLLPVLVLFEEVRRKWRPTWLAGAAAVCLLQALFPTTLLKFTFFPELPWGSVFGMGSLAATLDGSPTWNGHLAEWLHNQFQNIRWLAGWHLIVLFPPLLLALAVGGFLIASIGGLRRLNVRPVGSIVGQLRTQPAEFRVVLSFVAAVCLAGLKCWKGDINTVGLFLSLGLAIMAFQQSSLLAVWFLLAFLPFLKVFTEPVHLAYAMVPASIAVAAAVEKLWSATARGTWPLRVVRAVTAVMLAVAVVDHGLTLYGSYRVVTAANDGIQQVGDWLRQHTPAGSLVIGNGLQMHDIRLVSKGHIACYVACPGPLHRWTVQTPRQLEALLAENFGRHDVYLLDTDYEFSPTKAPYHAHRFVQNAGVAKADLGPIHLTRVQYPFADPLRNFLPARYVTFLGTPDLENDFYHGPALDGRFQHLELGVEYHLYKVTDKRVRDYWYPEGPWTVVRDNVHGYEIVQLNGRYFALPRETEFNVRHILRGRVAGSVVGDDLQDVLRRIDAGDVTQKTAHSGLMAN